VNDRDDEIRLPRRQFFLAEEVEWNDELAPGELFEGSIWEESGRPRRFCHRGPGDRHQGTLPHLPPEPRVGTGGLQREAPRWRHRTAMSEQIHTSVNGAADDDV
jgi:hypothetical protein